jgi:hypothetical protein
MSIVDAKNADNPQGDSMMMVLLLRLKLKLSFGMRIDRPSVLVFPEGILISQIYRI